MTNVDELKIDAVVYFVDSWGTKWCGIANNIIDCGNNGIYVEITTGPIDEDNRFIGNSGALLEKVFLTKKELDDYVHETSDNLKDKYRKSINNVNELVSFCLNNDVSSCEYCDYEAREVAIEKAAEFDLDLDLDY